MKLNNPLRKVGIIAFNNEVTIIGDGFSVPETIAGDKLKKYDEIFQIGSNQTHLFSHVVQESSDKIIDQCNKFEENGRTALGPALLAAISIATKGKPGSMVIICTDGLANIGIGNLDCQNEKELKDANDFYEKAGNLAKDNGIIISIITIKGEGCKIETIGKLSDLTNGNVTRVNPQDISKDFSNILNDEIVGTDVKLLIRLHKGLKFRNEDALFLAEDGSFYQKEIGNATSNIELTFEYELKPDDKLQQLQIHPEMMKQVPFQAQIHYTSVDGNRMLRVISQIQKTTGNLKEAEQHANVQLLHKRGMQLASNFALDNQYDRSAMVNQKWLNYLENNDGFENKKDEETQLLHKKQKKNSKYFI